MADKKTKKAETEGTKLTREYIIPLRKKFRVVPRYKKANRAVKAIKEFLVKHMKIRDRDLNKVKLDSYLNEYIWSRGIKKPPARVKVKAIKDSKTGIVTVELVNVPEKLKYKKQRQEKAEQKAQEKAEQKKQEQQSMMQKAQQSAKAQKSQEQPQEQKTEEKASEETNEEKQTEKEKKQSPKTSEQKTEEKQASPKKEGE